MVFIVRVETGCYPSNVYRMLLSQCKFIAAVIDVYEIFHTLYGHKLLSVSQRLAEHLFSQGIERTI
jgi:hypothetical protein